MSDQGCAKEVTPEDHLGPKQVYQVLAEVKEIARINLNRAVDIQSRLVKGGPKAKTEKNADRPQHPEHFNELYSQLIELKEYLDQTGYTLQFLVEVIQ